ncbi:MAG: hypothetical protein GC160_15495 [Acidobacteria bacterium]|nr:hypothetical protein [Acidobacteriota bacterium]
MRSIVVGIVLVVIVGLLGYFAWDTYEARQASVCSVCSRPLHSGSSVMAKVNGESQHFCCAACALWTERQTGAEVEITQASDYTSGSVLDPSEVTFVVGSSVNHCLQQHSVFDSQRTTLDQAKEAGTLEFDRCSPSILAFRTKSAAARFADQKGGRLTSLEGLRQLLP